MDDALADFNIDDIDFSGVRQINIPTTFVDIIKDSDALLIIRAVPGNGETIGVGVAAHTMRLASTYFAAEMVLAESATDPNFSTAGKGATPWIDVSKEGHSLIWLLCMNIIHFQHHLLPTAVDADTLLQIARFANKYSFVSAISWSTSNWFDRIYSQKRGMDIIPMIEATVLLDQPVYFARFTSRLLLHYPLPVPAQCTQDSVWANTDIILTLSKQRQFAYDAIRRDLDFILEPVAVALSKTGQHLVDYAVGVTPDADEHDKDDRPAKCMFDSKTAMTYLSSLSDATIWPSFAWPDSPGQVIHMLRDWHMPTIDDSDKCDFCLPLYKEFTDRLHVVRKQHNKRQWGLCLDCLIGGRVKPGACRIEHATALAL